MSTPVSPLKIPPQAPVRPIAPAQHRAAATLSETPVKSTKPSSTPVTEVTPEHAAVIAALFAPKDESIHDRAEFGREVLLEPCTSSETTVKVMVESEGVVQEFIIHSDLLGYYSPHFHEKLGKQNVITTKARIRSKMLRREWRWEHERDVGTMEGNGFGDGEGKIQVNVRIRLPGAIREIHLDKSEVGNVNRVVFSAFVDWLYNGIAGFDLKNPYFFRYDGVVLIQLWVFAGKVGIPALQNHCIEGIEYLRQRTNYVHCDALRWVYDNTTDYHLGECRLRKLLIDQCAWMLDGNWILAGGLTLESEIPREALIDILGRIRLMLHAGVRQTDIPPFGRREWRRALYWIDDDGYRAGSWVTGGDAVDLKEAMGSEITGGSVTATE